MGTTNISGPGEYTLEEELQSHMAKGMEIGRATPANNAICHSYKRKTGDAVQSPNREI